MWIIFALLTALTLSTSDALTKRALSSRNEYFVAWARLVFSLPVFIGTFVFVQIPSLDATFWIVVVCSLPLEIAAMILYTKALKISPISMTVPFLALTPVFLIITSNILLGEKVSPYGAVGIILMAIGAYALNIHKIRHDLLEPLKAVLREKGSVMMIIVAFIFSITASLGKLAIEHSSPVFFGSFYFILVLICFTPIAYKMNGNNLTIKKEDIKPLAFIGLTFSCMIIFHMISISMTKVAYMIAVKRTSLLFSIGFGYFLFKEEKIAEKALGGSLMLAGFIVIVLGR